MRLPLPYLALIQLPSSNRDARPALDVWTIPALAPERVSGKRLRVLLCIFSVLLFLNVAKFVLLGSVLGCG